MAQDRDERKWSGAVFAAQFLDRTQTLPRVLSVGLPQDGGGDEDKRWFNFYLNDQGDIQEVLEVVRGIAADQIRATVGPEGDGDEGV
jgi:hypothetical protein